MPAASAAGGRKIVDLGVGMAAGLVAKLFADLGDTVTRLEASQGDPFYDIYPAYRHWHGRADVRSGQDGLHDLLADADLCIVGGEDFPGLDWAFDPAALRARHPHLVVLALDGYVARAGSSPPAVDLLVQARTGLAHTEYSVRPKAYAAPLPTYGAAIVGMIGAQTALLERSRTGRGELVRTSLEQGAALWTPGIWSAAEKPDASFDIGMPKDVREPVFRCANDEYLIMIFGTPGSLHATYKTLGIDIEVDPKDRALPDISRGPAGFFCDRTIIEPVIATRDRGEVLEGFWAGGVASDVVLAAGAAWDDTQVVFYRIIEPMSNGGRAVGLPIELNIVESTGPAPPARPAGPAPLSGIRIVDLGSYVAGPFAGKLLADLGADVIKVEPPEGDPFRWMYRNFASVTRGKRSLAVDLKQPEGLEILRRLVGTADVFCHNMRVGVADRNGFDPETLRKLNPRLVTLHNSAYGKAGPKAVNSGWDPVLQAYCGHAIRGGGEDNEPLVYSTPILDYGSGALGAVAILEGLMRRDSAGAGVEIDTSLLNTGIYMLSELIQAPDGAFLGAPVLDRAQTGFHPAESLYEVRDGWVAIAARDEAMAGRLAHMLDLHLGPRVGWGDAARAAIAAAIRPREAATLLAALAEADIWAERCEVDAWQALEGDRDARAIGFVAERQDPKYGALTAVGQYLTLESHQLPTLLPDLPALGGHSAELLGELGYSDAEIAALTQKGVVAVQKG